MVERRFFRPKRRGEVMQRRINPQFRLKLVQRYQTEEANNKVTNTLEKGETKNVD